MSDIIYKQLNEKDCAEILLKNAKEHKKALIIAHRNPDGDAVGSAFALKKLYAALGGEADCACCDKIPEYLNFLVKQESFLNEITGEYDIILSTDVASPAQLGSFSYLAEKHLMAIDHHKSCTEYCDSYRDPDAGAAGEMIYNICRTIEETNDMKLETDIYRLIYAAISADTGSFRYSNTTEKTHMIASQLISRINEDKDGLSCAEISRNLHDRKTLSELRAKSYCIENLKIKEDGKIAYVILSCDDTEKMGLTADDFGSAIDIPRSLAGVEIAFTVKDTSETGKNGMPVFKISSRSNTEVNVAEICAKYNGGGHAKAAGASVEAKDHEAAAEIMCCEFKKAIRSANEQKR